MTVRLNPYIAFSDGNARAAMEFYHSVFGGDLAANTFGEFGAPDAALADKIMHAMLTTGDGLALMGADSPPGMEHVAGNNIAISLSGDEPDRLREYWTKLSDGGTVTTPLEKQMWGDEFGTCKDKFGIEWMVNIAAPSA
jgi:PhnB protein